ncbi:DUF2769 domain-containing protein [Methanosarcina mazei]|nr:DUF2769 domain-containing protein [Methanosarcina mazei]
MKACLCKYCSSYPGGAGMFCARGGMETGKGKKDECLCETCVVFKKFLYLSMNLFKYEFI